MTGLPSGGGLAGLLALVRRSLGRHLLSSTVTAASLALACGLVMGVFAIEGQARRAFTGGQSGFDAVLGPRSSPLQLVLNTVFHLETSPGNIPWSLYEELAADPRVAAALPYAVGDSHAGFRIVGTSADLLEIYEYGEGERLAVAPPGEAFDPARREALIGSFVAQETGLTYGSSFHPGHGVDPRGDGSDEHEEDYVVVGVLEPTNTPADRVIWIPIGGVFRMEGHVLRGAGEEFIATPGEPIPSEHKQVSAVLLDLKGGPPVAYALAQSYDRIGCPTTLAYPIAHVMTGFFSKLGWMTSVLRLVAYLVVVVAAASVLTSLYNTMNERRRELAILRALGARRSTVFSVIVLEAGAISLIGALASFLAYAAILLTAAVIVRAQTGVVLDLTRPHPVLGLAPVGLTALGALVGIIPAIKAYRTDVAANLR